jgi:putative hydrolase
MKSGKLFFKGSELRGKKLTKVDAQMHTKWTDGNHSIREMIDQSQRIEMQSILFSEHTSELSYVWFPKFANEVRIEKELNETIEILVGTETKCINQSGEIYIHPDVEKNCDLIMGVVHRIPKGNNKFYEFNQLTGKQALELEYEITLNLLRNRNIDILGHTMGMTIERYGVLPNKAIFESIIQECIKNSIIFEINSKYHKKILKDLVTIISDSEVYFTIGSDAHNKFEIGNCWSLIDEIRNK